MLGLHLEVGFSKSIQISLGGAITSNQGAWQQRKLMSFRHGKNQSGGSRQFKRVSTMISQLSTTILLYGLINFVSGCSRQCATCETTMTHPYAKAVFYANAPAGTSVTGTIKFTALSNGETSISGTLAGLPASNHGFHIHTYGDLTTCSTAGGHYNPFELTHGGPTDSIRHVGDLGNIAGGRLTVVSMTDKLVKLSGPTSVIGRTLVIHANPDDLGKGDSPNSKINGNSGPRIACAIIGISQ